MSKCADSVDVSGVRKADLPFLEAIEISSSDDHLQQILAKTGGEGQGCRLFDKLSLRDEIVFKQVFLD